jgi:hypothetical protein
MTVQVGALEYVGVTVALAGTKRVKIAFAGIVTVAALVISMVQLVAPAVIVK